MALGTERSTLTMPSSDSVRPLRPPIAVAVAVKSGLILSMASSRREIAMDRVWRKSRRHGSSRGTDRGGNRLQLDALAVRQQRCLVDLRHFHGELDRAEIA